MHAGMHARSFRLRRGRGGRRVAAQRARVAGRRRQAASRPNPRISAARTLHSTADKLEAAKRPICIWAGWRRRGCVALALGAAG